MSTDDRLARLGLSHLKDKPEELKKALEEGLAEDEARVAAWHERQARAIREALERMTMEELQARLREYDEELAEAKAQGMEPSPAFTAQHERLRAELARRRPG